MRHRIFFAFNPGDYRNIINNNSHSLEQGRSPAGSINNIIIFNQTMLNKV